MLSDTGAFSQLAATRGASIGTSEDDEALLGLEPVDVAAVGTDGDLLSVTNNTGVALTTSVSLSEPRPGESVDPSQVTLAQGDTERIAAFLDADRATDDGVDIEIVGSSPELSLELHRTIPVPSFSWQVFDDSRHGNVQFDVSYTVGNVPNATVDIDIVNTNTGNSESHSGMAGSGNVTYPGDGGREGGAGGDEYVITFDVTAAGRRVLQREVTITGGESAGEGDPGSDDDPQLDWFFVDDLLRESTDHLEYAVYYQVSNLDNFGEVEVTFSHDSQNDWATRRTTSSQRPVGMVTHETGNSGFDFDIIVRVKNTSGATVDSETRSDTGDGENPPNPELAVADSPTFETLEIADESSNGGAEYVIDYTIDNEDRFGEVRAQFENLGGNPETNATVSDSSGTLTYSAGYTGGDEYRITIRLFEDRNGVHIPVSEDVYVDDANGTDPEL